MSLNSFKSFVRLHPELIDYVNRKEQSWQGFYNLYELYGENSSIWNNYKGKETATVTLKDFVNQLKNIDVSELQKSITSIQKGIGYVSGLLSKKDEEVKESLYQPKPMHKYFDD